MPIIYSYPVNDDILDTDLLVGTSTVSVGTKRKNQTKNFSMLDVYDYIVDKIPEPEIPTLQEVTTAGATSDKSILIDVGGAVYTPAISGSGADIGVYGYGSEGYGVRGDSSTTAGVGGFGLIGVYGFSIDDKGIKGSSTSGVGVFGESASGRAGAFSIPTESTSNIVEFTKGDDNQVSISHDGNITANSFIKIGGTSSQFLMADGSVTTGSGTTPTLQQVTDVGAITTNKITVNVSNNLPAIIASNTTGLGLFASSDDFVVGRFNLDTAENTSNIVEFQKNTINQAYVTHNGTIVSNKLLVNTTVDNGVDALQINGSLIATSIKKTGGLSTQFLMADGSTSTGGGATPNLQQVTTAGATTTNPITLNTATVGSGGLQVLNSGAGIGVYGLSDGKGVYGYSFLEAALYGYAESATGIGVKGYAEDGVGGEFETDASIANIANFKKSGVLLASVGNSGDITANSFIKTGGTSSQILAADGSVITAGTNITITGGQISSVGGSGGGGSSVNYYLNGGTSQGTFGGTTYYEFSRTAVIGTGADFSRGTNGYIASFITDVADPSLLLIPAGNWNLEFFFSSSSAGGSPSFYAELYKYDGTTFTLIASGSAVPEGITNGTSIDAYFTGLAVPETILTVNDRLAIRVFVNASSKTITLHTQNGHLCEVVTTFTAGLTALNGLQAQVQNFASGTTGTDFDIVSSGSTHTFNLPSASATARGAVTTGTQTFAGAKTFSSVVTIPNGVNATEAVNKGQLDLKANNNEVVKLIVNEFPGTTVTGTLSETLLSTTTIAAGTFPTSCMPDIRIKFSKSGDLGNAVMRLRINTVNNFATATQIGTYAAVAATDTFLISRNPVISSGNMNIFIATSSGQSDTSAVATTESNFAMDVANTIYLFVSVAPGSTTDITTLRAFKIIN